MRLKKITIRNFRSIRDQALVFKHNFLTLVGINESGKSNVLRALSLLDEAESISPDDVRDPGHDEPPVDSSYVRFVFALNADEVEDSYRLVQKKILCDNYDDKILDEGNKPLTLFEFQKKHEEVLYIVNLLMQSKSFTYWGFGGPTFRIYSNWKKVKPGATFGVNLKGQTVNISSYSIVNTNDFPSVPENMLEDFDIKYLNTLCGAAANEIAEPKFPDCTTWKYTETNLLPARINMQQFMSDPSTCVPLRNMFLLAGHENPSDALKDAEKRTNGITNLLRKVGENTTSHMKRVWPEWKNLKVSVSQNGGFIEAGIEDDYNVYSLSRRSDGFKRFFTFLLMISARSETGDIAGHVIVIDEPDIGLHPTGIQYLRDELIKISKRNFVVISTHSIFMVDKDVIDRHLLVSKTKEVTSFESAGPSNLNDEEVIYQALGYSVFHLLKPVNIIFEGWRDKRIFETFIKSKRAHEINNHKALSGIGLVHAFGVKDIPRVANFCENVPRKYVIISDSDKPAKERKNSFAGDGKWYCYTDVDGVDAITTEDFLSNTLINRAIRHVLRERGFGNGVSIPNDVSKDKIKYLEKELHDVFGDEAERKTIIEGIKNYLVDNAKAADYSDAYPIVCSQLVGHILSNK